MLLYNHHFTQQRQGDDHTCHPSSFLFPHQQTPCPPTEKTLSRFFSFLDARGIHGVLSLEMFPSHVLLKEWNGETPKGVGNLTFSKTHSKRLEM